MKQCIPRPLRSREFYVGTLIVFVFLALLCLLYITANETSSVEHFSTLNQNHVKNAIANNPLSKITVNHDYLKNRDQSYAYHLPLQPILHQYITGQCWLFAFNNILRSKMISVYDLPKEFCLSTSYFVFWDKYEKARYFLHNIHATRHLPIDDRLVKHLLKTPIEEGGTWEMAVNIYTKYGAVPLHAMQPTFHSHNSRDIIRVLNANLRDMAMNLRASNATDDPHTYMKHIERILIAFYGEPPRQFRWIHKDRDDSQDSPTRKSKPDAFSYSNRLWNTGGELLEPEKSASLEVSNKTVHDPMTPLEFKNRVVRFNPDDFIHLCNYPLEQYPYYTRYTVTMCNNTAEGMDYTLCNVPIDDLISTTQKTIQSGTPVWFACDVSKHIHAATGTLSRNVFDQSFLYDGPSSCGDIMKQKRLNIMTLDSVPNHAMTLVGFNEDKSRHPTQWLIENSWGSKPKPTDGSNDKKDDVPNLIPNPMKGYLHMSNSWFKEYVYSVIVHKSACSQKILECLGRTPTILKPWDYIGCKVMNR